MSTTKDIEPEQITNMKELKIESTPRDGSLSRSASTTNLKVKDPKKVKAGKALARKNAEMKKNVENNASLHSEEISSQEETSSTNVDVSTIYNGIQSIAGLVGAGFTLYHGWKFFEKSDWGVTTSEAPPLQTKLIPNKPKVEEVEKTALVSPSLRG